MMLSFLLCSIYSKQVRRSSPHVREGDDTRVWLPGGRDHWRPCQQLPVTQQKRRDGDHRNSTGAGEDSWYLWGRCMCRHWAKPCLCIVSVNPPHGSWNQEGPLISLNYYCSKDSRAWLWWFPLQRRSLSMMQILDWPHGAAGAKEALWRQELDRQSWTHNSSENCKWTQPEAISYPSDCGGGAGGIRLVRVWGILMHCWETINLYCHFGGKFGRIY